MIKALQIIFIICGVIGGILHLANKQPFNVWVWPFLAAYWCFRTYMFQK